MHTHESTSKHNQSTPLTATLLFLQIEDTNFAHTNRSNNVRSRARKDRMAVRQRRGKKTGAAAAPADAADKKKAGKVEGPYTSYGTQLLLILVLAAPWVVLGTVPLSEMKLEAVLGKELRSTVYSVEDVKKELTDSLFVAQAFETSYVESSVFWKTVAALSVPHVFYFLVWTNSKKFYWFASKFLSFLGEPYQAFAKLAHMIKLFQTCAIVLWYATPEWLFAQTPQTIVDAALVIAQRLSVTQALLGVELFLLGQLFNGAVYKAIGEAGVYYGCRLGKDIPWVYGFPYNTVPHAQYLGATISIWGGCVLFATEHHVSQGLYGIGAIMAVFYTFSSLVESRL